MPTAVMSKNILDLEQHEYFFTTSDLATYRQWCVTDQQAAAWALAYSDAANDIGITLRVWGRMDGRKIVHP